MACTLKPSECGSRTSGSTVLTMPKNLPKMTKLQQHDSKYSSFWQSCVSFPGLVPAFVPTFCSLGASPGPFTLELHASIVYRVPPIPSAARLHSAAPQISTFGVHLLPKFDPTIRFGKHMQKYADIIGPSLILIFRKDRTYSYR